MHSCLNLDPSAEPISFVGIEVRPCYPREHKVIDDYMNENYIWAMSKPLIEVYDCVSELSDVEELMEGIADGYARVHRPVKDAISHGLYVDLHDELRGESDLVESRWVYTLYFSLKGEVRVEVQLDDYEIPARVIELSKGLTSLTNNPAAFVL